MKKFALAGNPNCGKTTLFNALTGSTAHVGNWPGVTVDKREGVYKKCEQPISIVDLPGIYSLSPYTPEEIISRNYILDEKPDCVINVVDATNLERNLYLTTQVMEIDSPMIIALNMIDEVEKRGDKIDVKKLEERIGVPVVAVSALKERGLDELMRRAYEASQTMRIGKTVLEKTAVMSLIEKLKAGLNAELKNNALFHSIKLAELDELEVALRPKYAAIVEEAKEGFKDKTFGSDIEAFIADSRYKYISKYYSPSLTKNKQSEEQNTITKSDKIDKVMTHKFFGIPIFLVVLFFIFHMTFSEDLFYLGAMGVFDKTPTAYDANGQSVNITEDVYDDSVSYFDEDGFLAELTFEGGELLRVEAKPYVYLADGEKVLAAEAAAMDNTKFYAAKGEKWEVTIEGDEESGFEIVFLSQIDKFASEVNVHTFFGYEDGVYSLGVVLFNTLETFTGFLGVCVEQGLANAGAAEWLSGLVSDGALGGLFAVMSFLPQILLLFLFFSILEDSGYMARIAFILDKIFRKFGLSGRAFMPMIMGFGCSIPAMINTRTLADQNERTATIRVIPFFSCGAKLPILTAIAGGIIQLVGVGNADVITYSMYLLGVVTAIVCVLLMRSTTMRGETPPFIMELPSYRLSAPKSLALHLWDKAKHFIKKAFTIILASTIFIWFVSHFSWNWQFLSDEQMNQSILAGLGGLLQPLFTPLGFGSQLGAWGWVFVVAAATGLIAKENVIATFGALSACIIGSAIDIEADGGVTAVSAMVAATGITAPALLAFIAFNMTTIPCFAAVAAAKAELPTKAAYKNTLLFWISVSYIVASMVYIIGSWWQTAFIFAAAWAAVITLIVLSNKGKIKLGLVAKLKVNKNKKAKGSCCGGCGSCPYHCNPDSKKKTD